MTDDREATVVVVGDADHAIRGIRALGRRIVTFSGFSGNGYEDPAALKRLLSGVLRKLNPHSDVVCSGATEVGIGVVYSLASSRGFTTVGIVSSNALKVKAAFAKDVDIVFVVEDSSWGGYLPGTRTPSPTSRAMVDASDAMYYVGGGEIARDEFDYAKGLKKPVEFFPADMNHAAAIENARKKGLAPPVDFAGSLHEYLKKSSK